MSKKIFRKIVLYFLFFVNLTEATVAAQTSKLTVWIPNPPSSCDPLDFDSFVHHITFRSAFGTLVSQYKRGEFLPVLAESWSTNKDKTEWSFVIRKDLKFSNGDRLTPVEIESSFRRIAWILKSKKSYSELFSRLVGYSAWSNHDKPIAGLKITNQVIHFKFSEPFDNLLEEISFGMYSAVHPTQYQQNTLKWEGGRNFISSASYHVGAWTQNGVDLVLRKDIPPEWAHTNAFDEIKIVWEPDSKKKADLIVSESNDLFPAQLNMKFSGGAVSGITFARCYNFSDPNHICGKKIRREMIRQILYEATQIDKTDISHAFLPPALSGAGESFQLPVHTKESITKELSGFRKLRVYFRAKNINGTIDTVKNNLAAALNKYNLTSEEVELSTPEMFAHFSPIAKKLKADIGIHFTGLLIEAPEADLRFMFLSKQGVSLPDLEGKLTGQLTKSRMDYNLINQVLWNDAVILPLGHFSSGFWSGNSVDSSQINLALPPIDFQWIGKRN